MLGWFIIVRRSGSETGRVGADPCVLATWETSIDGLDWIEELERAGKASCVSRNGYPTRYTAVAHVVVPLLQAGSPPQHVGLPVIGDDYVTPAGWSGTMTVHRERLARCPSDEMLVVDAWDQSCDRYPHFAAKSAILLENRRS